MRHLVLIGSTTLALALAVSACGGNGMDDMDMGDASSTTATSAPSAEGASEAGAASTDFNDADVTFAQQMIPHHRQATEMSALAPGRAEGQAVKDLAADIAASQQPEIETMTGLLVTWGEAVPEDMSGMEGMDHGGMAMDEMPGMMSVDEMSALEASTGAEFDRMFLAMMIEHHEGAIEMAETEQRDGQNPDAVALASSIAKEQGREIQEMQDLLDE